MSALSERDASILRGIIDDCRSIQSRISRYNISKQTFQDNADLREMLLFPLLQIGELANHLDDGIIEAHREIPWKDIIGMRHIIVHGYGSLDAVWAWDTIVKDVPNLMQACTNILASEEDRQK